MPSRRTRRRPVAALAVLAVIASAGLAVLSSLSSPEEPEDRRDRAAEVRGSEAREERRLAALADRARIALAAGNFDAAAEAAREVGERDPALAREIGNGLLARAKQAADGWNLDEARRLLDLAGRALHTSPELAGAEMDLGVRQQARDEAVRLLEAADAAREAGDLGQARILAERVLEGTAPPDLAGQATGLLEDVATRSRAIADRGAMLGRVRDLLEHGDLARATRTLRDYSRTSGDRSLDGRLETLEGLEAEGGLGAYGPVRSALLWLKAHQDPKDGAFHASTLTASCKNAGCGPARGNAQYDAALTGLAIIAFTGFRELDLLEEFGEPADRAAKWLAGQVEVTGRVKGAGGPYYTEAIVALALLERRLAGAAKPEETVAAKRIVDVLCRTWVLGGGWRYGAAARDADVSVTCWVLQALHAANASGLTVPEQAVHEALDYLDRATDGDGRTHYTTAGAGRTESMTPAALLVRFLFGQSRADPLVEKGLAYVAGSRPAASLRTGGKRAGNKDRDAARLYNGNVSFYRWYYETYALKLGGGSEWEAYGPSVEKALRASQETEGHEAGSWDPVGQWARRAGRVYSTALNTLTLEVYYRHKAGLRVTGERKKE